MKILLLNSIAEKQSTGQIMYELYSFLKRKGNEVIFCYGRGPKVENNSDFIKIDSKIEVYTHVALSRLTGLQGYYSNVATIRVIKIIEKFKPDVVILGNIHGYYINAFNLLRFLKKMKILTFYYMFDEYAFVGKCAFFDTCDKYLTECRKCPKKQVYPSSLFFDSSNKIFKDKLEIYSGFNSLRFIGVPYTVSRARSAALLKKTNAIVYSYGWGINTHGAFVPKDNVFIKKRLGIPEENTIILAVAPYSNPRKGIGKYYYPIAESLKEYPISFVHVGFDGANSELPNNIITIPFINDAMELAEYFSMADLFVITSISEGYPTVCLDALSCGTPICGFDISGTPYVAEEPFGVFVEAFNVEAMKKIIINTKTKTQDVIDACRKYAENNLDSNIIYEKVLSQIQNDLRVVSETNV